MAEQSLAITRIELSFSLRLPNGESNTGMTDLQRDELLNLFPRTFGYSFISLFLVLHVEKLPPKPWPVFVADLPLYLTTEIETPWDKSEGSTNGPTWHMPHLHIERMMEPSHQVFAILLERMNVEFDGCIESIEFDGLSFLCVSKQTPNFVWRGVVPRKVNRFFVNYAWRLPSVDETARRNVRTSAEQCDEGRANYSLITASHLGEPGASSSGTLLDDVSSSQPRIGDTVFLGTAADGFAEGRHVKTCGKRSSNISGTRDREHETVFMRGFYFGNGGLPFENVSCGGVIWDEDWNVRGQFQFQETESPYNVYAAP